MNPKVKIYTDSKKNTYAVGKYCGRTIKGVARLNPEDEPNPAFGEILAISRYNDKYLSCQLEDIRIDLIEAIMNYERAKETLDKISNKANKIFEEKEKNIEVIENLLNQLR